MSKSKSKQLDSVKTSKKGMIINRKHNRTVNFDVAQNEPKWKHVTDANDNVTNIIMRRGTGDLLRRNRMLGHWEGVAKNDAHRSI